jgi:hypothetical protein
MKRFLLFAGVCILVSAPLGAALTLNPLYEQERVPGEATGIDRLVLQMLGENRLEPAPLCSDAVFLRRVSQDLTGSVLPNWQVKRFLADQSPDKRRRMIDTLMRSEPHYEYWTLKWGDILRVKSEFPVNLWPNATQAYHRWIYTAVKTNLRYDEFARALLLSSGSNFRNPEANFYRAVSSKTPEGLARVAMLTFMGARFDKWPSDGREALAQFFSRIRYKRTNEWKEEIVYTELGTGQPISTRLPNGRQVRIPADEDPRQVLTDWLVADDNPWFARCAVNRIWYWLMGRGLIEEADDIRPESVSANPALLEYLETTFVESGYDTAKLIAQIVNSQTYQQSFIPRNTSAKAEALFAHYSVRRLDAEVIIDTLDALGAGRQKYSSPIPEPFTYVPPENRTIALSDGSIGSQFLSQFGRPSRDSGQLAERQNTSSSTQRLFLLNSNEVQKKLTQGYALRKILRKSKLTDQEAIDEIYLLLLGRHASPGESQAVRKYATTAKVWRRQAWQDLAWALLNSKEFLYHH